MSDPLGFRSEYDRLAAIVEEALPGYLELDGGDPARIVVEASRYSLLGGGKRIRPVLSLAVAKMFGCPVSAILPFACSVEMIHTYSLIHDDLPCMDDDDLRRGRPTCHKVYGESIAVLAGDALLNRAFEILSEACLEAARDPRRIPGGVEGALRAMTSIAHAAGAAGLIGGQTIDLSYEGLPMDAALLEAMAAAWVSGVDEAGAGAVDRFADALGLAFQIKDDLLDITADAKTLGKTPGKDAVAGKNTFVSLHGLDAASARLAEETVKAGRALDVLEKRDFDVGFLRGLLRYQLERGK